MLSRSLLCVRCRLYRRSGGLTQSLQWSPHQSSRNQTRNLGGEPVSALEANKHKGSQEYSKSRSIASKQHAGRSTNGRCDIRVQGRISPLSIETAYLRDACSCSRCVDPSTGQKLFQSADIPPDIDVEKIQYLSGERTQITWIHDISGYESHTSTFSSAFLERTRSARAESCRSFPRRVTWDGATIAEHCKSFAYDDFLGSSEILHGALNQTYCYGIAFLHSVPSEPSAVERIAEKIGPLRNTFYGSTWDVRALASAKNIAYTSQDLGFHMDLLYMADPPGLQILHAIEASTRGGESLFSDGMGAVYRMRNEPPQVLKILGSHLVTYRYKNDGQWYQYRRPTIEGAFLWDRYGCELPSPNASRSEAVLNWSPPFQAPFDSNPRYGTIQPESQGTSMREYIEAANLFKSSLEAPEAVFETKMQGGTCVIFDNRRVVHARKAYTTDSERWLRGAYVDKDPLHSRLRVLNAEFGVPDLRPLERRESSLDILVECDLIENPSSEAEGDDRSGLRG